MDYQSKKIAVEAIIRAVDYSPTMQYRKNQPQKSMSTISLSEYSTWLSYVYSILDIVANEIGSVASSVTLNQIKMIDNNDAASFASRITQIDQELLDLAKTILNQN